MSRLDHPLSSEATSGMEMLSRKFERLKSDFRAQFGTSFDFLRDTAIYDTPLYKFLELMPKGADLHRELLPHSRPQAGSAELVQGRLEAV